MQNISHYLDDIRTCIESFCINIESGRLSNTEHFLYTDAIIKHKKLFLELLHTSDPSHIETKTQEMVTYTIENDIPYMFVYGELVTVTRKLLGKLIEARNFDDLAMINQFFSEHEDRITTLYLTKFLDQMLVKYNLRLSHIVHLYDKNLLNHYEDHIRWMIQLIFYVQHAQQDVYPELRHTHCYFGKWLHETTVSYLISTSHFAVIENLHVNLHDLAANLVDYSRKPHCQSATLIHLMQRIDYISLEIGNEIAILNEIEVSSKDPLTELLSRRLLNKILLNQLTISQATNQELSLIMCDLDYFKKINDTHGHIAGDAVLRDFSDLLRATFRQGDYIFRFGGEEFLIVLPATSEEAAYSLANSLCFSARARKVAYETTSLEYTISVGVTSISNDTKQAINEELILSYLASVDGKVYNAKASGRNQVQ
jgi:diguanylate cyclase (GGDEF)-like protein